MSEIRGEDWYGEDLGAVVHTGSGAVVAAG